MRNRPIPSPIGSRVVNLSTEYSLLDTRKQLHDNFNLPFQSVIRLLPSNLSWKFPEVTCLSWLFYHFRREESPWRLFYRLSLDIMSYIKLLKQTHGRTSKSYVSYKKYINSYFSWFQSRCRIIIQYINIQRYNQQLSCFSKQDVTDFLLNSYIKFVNEEVNEWTY